MTSDNKKRMDMDLPQAMRQAKKMVEIVQGTGVWLEGGEKANDDSVGAAAGDVAIGSEDHAE